MKRLIVILIALAVSMTFDLGVANAQLPTNTPVLTNTPTATATVTLTPTPTQTATPSQTPTPTATNTATPANTSTNTPLSTSTSTSTPTMTFTPTITQTPTLTPTPTISTTPTATSVQCAPGTATTTATPPRGDLAVVAAIYGSDRQAVFTNGCGRLLVDAVIGGNGTASNVNVAQVGGVNTAASAALGDTTTNPTVASWGSYLFGYTTTGGGTWNRLRSWAASVGPGNKQDNILGVGPLVYEATANSQYSLAAPSADAMSNTTSGIPASGLMGYNGATWDRLRTVGVGDGQSASVGILASGGYLFNATTGWNRAYSLRGAADTNSGDFAAWTGLSGFNGSTWDRIRTSTVGTGVLTAAPPDYSYKQIAAGQATTVVKASAGFLHAICLNSAATATNVTTVYDNASGAGTVIAIPAATTATVPTCMTYDVVFPTGLTIITTTANGANMTVSYR